MNHSLGLAIESLVAVLLLVTIGYCTLLNTRLKRLKSDEHSLKAVIAELITATEIAERAIGGLKDTVRDVNEHLGSQLASAAEPEEAPEPAPVQVATPTPVRVSSAKAVAAAAQAFSDRNRRRSGGLAA